MRGREDAAPLPPGWYFRTARDSEEWGRLLGERLAGGLSPPLHMLVRHELLDMLAVVFGLADVSNWSRAELLEEADGRRLALGGFDGRLILVGAPDGRPRAPSTKGAADGGEAARPEAGQPGRVHRRGRQGVPGAAGRAAESEAGAEEVRLADAARCERVCHVRPGGFCCGGCDQSPPLLPADPPEPPEDELGRHLLWAARAAWRSGVALEHGDRRAAQEWGAVARTWMSLDQRAGEASRHVGPATMEVDEQAAAHVQEAFAAVDALADAAREEAGLRKDLLDLAGSWEAGAAAMGPAAACLYRHCASILRDMAAIDGDLRDRAFARGEKVAWAAGEGSSAASHHGAVVGADFGKIRVRENDGGAWRDWLLAAEELTRLPEEGGPK